MTTGSTPIAELSERAGRARPHSDAVRTMFDRIAPTYDLLNHALSAGLDIAWRRRAVRALGRAPAGPVLDLCAGTMDLTRLLARARPADRVVAVDFSERMLALGKQKAPRAETVVADALSLPFADGEFAAVVCGFGVRNLSDPARGVREVRRVLKRGGVFVTLDSFRPSRSAARLFHRVYTRVLFARLGGAVSGDDGAYAYFARSVGSFWTRADYERELRDAGFERVTGRDVALGAASIVRAEVQG